MKLRAPESWPVVDWDTAEEYLTVTEIYQRYIKG